MTAGVNLPCVLPHLRATKPSRVVADNHPTVENVPEERVEGSTASRGATTAEPTLYGGEAGKVASVGSTARNPKTKRWEQIAGYLKNGMPFFASDDPPRDRIYRDFRGN
jgi:hypothetical protein